MLAVHFLRILRSILCQSPGKLSNKKITSPQPLQPWQRAALSGRQTVMCFTFLLSFLISAILIRGFLKSPSLRHSTIAISIRFGHMLEFMIPTTGKTVIRKAFKAFQQISVDRVMMFVIVVSGGRVMQIRWNCRCGIQFGSASPQGGYTVSSPNVFFADIAAI